MISTTDLFYILDTIEPKLPKQPEGTLNPFDKWLVSSCLQKSIRRGDVARAINCTNILWHTDKRALWRRLLCIATEDIGLGDLGATTESLAVCGCSKWRRRVGDLRAALYLVDQMARITKSRSITHLYMMAELAEEYQEARDQYAALENDELVAIVINKTQRPVNRCLALWYLSGYYPSNKLHRRDGCLDKAKEVMADLNAPYSLVQACMVNLKVTNWPGVLFAPLACDIFHDLETKTVFHELPETKLVKDMPLYACDPLYTRSGKASIRQLKASCESFEPFSPNQIGHAVFYVESSMLDRELVAPKLEELKQQSTQASLFSTGVSIENQERLIRAVQAKMARLNEIRKSALEAA